MIRLAIDQKPHYRPDEVARILCVDKRSVYRWIKHKKIRFLITPGGKIRIPIEEIERLLSGTNCI